MAIQVLPITWPSAVNGLDPQLNGNLGPCQLTDVFMYNVGHRSFTAAAKRAWDAMVVQCLGDTGFHLTSTDTYRTYQTQVNAFNTRMQSWYNPLTCTTITRVWNGKKYWLKRGYAPCATPGTSNHGWAIAVDVMVALGTTVVNIGNAQVTQARDWVIEHATEYGFSWETEQGTPGFELWHLRLVTGDEPTPRVLEVEAFLAAQAAA